MRFIPLHSDTTLPACTSGACHGGDLPCPTRDACRVAEDVVLDGMRSWITAAGLVLAIVSFCALAVRGDMPGPAPVAAAASAPLVAMGASR
jgi:hypothetical protein